MDFIEKKLRLENVDTLTLFGYNDSNLLLLENRFDATLTVRGDTLVIRGSSADVRTIEKILVELQYIIRRTNSLSTNDVMTVIDLVSGGATERISGTKETFTKEGQAKDILPPVIYPATNEVIKARNVAQQEYAEKVQKNDIVFAIGPAGTGKTYMAIALALSALKNRAVSRIVLTRPVVEAGESLGFLPGDFMEKVDPYLRPLLDALVEMAGAEKLKSMMDKKVVEIIPLAYMRGRTLNNSFIILDEAQNTTATQMKMFLTRLGRNSKAIVTGDVTQIDLPQKTRSGLIDARDTLQNIVGIDFAFFSKADVVRHRLVADIIDAYERKEKAIEQKRKKHDEERKQHDEHHEHSTEPAPQP